MQKRGLSGIVTLVLITLIAIVSIMILWLFVQPAVVEIIGNGKAGGGEYQRFITCSDLNLEVESCAYDNAIVRVGVKRGSGILKIANLVFEFEGNPLLSLNNSLSGDVPKEFNSSLISFDLADFNQIPENTRVTAILENNEVCQFDDLPTSCEEEPENFIECGNGVLETGEQCDDGNLINGDECDEFCRFEAQQNQSDYCKIESGIVYLGDFENNCTRIRDGLIDSDIKPIPYAGFHSAGARDSPQTAGVGAKYHRVIVSWHDAYYPNGSIKEGYLLEGAEQTLKDNNIKLVLTVRTNDPNRGTCSYTIGERSADEIDSYPRNESEWTSYVKFIVNKYYTQQIINGEEPLLAGIQVGNEWSHQFSVNTTNNPGCDINLVDGNVKIDTMINLTRLTYNAVQEAQQNLPASAKKLPVLAFGITGVDKFALKRGFNTNGFTYNGFFSNGIIINYPDDVSENTVSGIEKFITRAAPYYDYLDIHLRANFYYEHGFVAQWIRDLWKANGITGKGLIATEYAGPFSFYTTNYHKYFIPVSLAHSLFEGFDSIAWSPWNAEEKQNVNFALMSMTNSNRQARQYARDGYKTFTDAADGFKKIRLHGSDTYEFLDANNQVIGTINASQNIPAIPATFQQCSDLLDNDNDGQIDGQDSFCRQGSWAVDVEFDEAGIYF